MEFNCLKATELLRGNSFIFAKVKLSLLALKWINTFHSIFIFLYPLKILKTSEVLKFSGGMGIDQWHEMS